MIESHRLKPGEALPSEKELENKYGVSRITVRRALEELERSGRVVRSKGKSARVAQPFQAHARTRLDDDFMMMLDLVRGTQAQILLFEWQLPDEELQNLLELETREPVLRVDRLRKANGRPTLHTTAYVPASIGVKFDRAELANSTMIEQLAQTGIIPIQVDQYMSAVPCKEEIAAHLEVEVNSPIFQIQRLVRSDTDQIIQSLVISFRGDSFTYHLSAMFKQDSEEVEFASKPVFDQIGSMHSSLAKD
ncbi:hypothetical protein JI59_21725 (plasmid) [Novosphingobium pentaromativorans US6-1]|nr:hypothetical protein JI59_21725 [Novosphingobium pentaromativorans US6-1]